MAHPLFTFILNRIDRFSSFSPTVAFTHSGTPIVANINHKVRAGEHDAHHDSGLGPRHDVGSLPRWATRVNADAGILSARKNINALPSSIGVPRFFSTSSQVAETARADPNNVPDFSAYRTGDAESNRLYSYFVIGSLGLVSAAGAKSTVSDFLASMAASADVLALAKVEVEMASIPEGKNAIIKWRGKPVFVRHRTADEIEEANNVDINKLRDPQKDSDRVQRPEWLVMLGEPANSFSRARALSDSFLFRCLHASRLCADWRGWRLWRMVLPLPRIPLRHFRASSQGPCSVEL